MKPLDVGELSDAIFDFTSTRDAVLFSGAGVGKRVDLPTWPEYMRHLADICNHYGSSLSAQLIEQRVSSESYVTAAGIYEFCEEIPIGERWKGLSSPFTKLIPQPKLEELTALFQIPFGAVVTTNYDRSQLDAYALVHRRAPIPYELDDGTLKNGALQSGFFLARIHGRAERPTSMVLYPSSYLKLEGDASYKDFLLSLLGNRRCLFIGFSFVDPAIDEILTRYKALAGPVFKKLHQAILPSDASPKLERRLMELNIQVVNYDVAGGHLNLWKAIRKTAARFTAKTTVVTVFTSARPIENRFSTLQRFFAFAYAQQQTATEVRPLITQARDGMVLALAREAGAQGITEILLQEKVRQILYLSQEEVQPIVRDSLGRLLAQGDLKAQANRFLFTGAEPDILIKHLSILAAGVLDRMKVREGISPKEISPDMVQQVLERIFMARAWDLAAHYAGGGAGYGSDLNRVIKEVAGEVAYKKPAFEVLALEQSCLNLLSSPTDREAPHLAEVGRTAFAIQLVLSSPRQALLQRFSLPERIYLDASILLPTLVPGHPLRPVYSDAIKRLKAAANEAGVRCELLVGEPFLNEVISHRNLALDLAREIAIDGSPKNLQQLITFYGAENTNVFIGAFSSHVSKAEMLKERRPAFKAFLRQYAPYQTEAELAQYLSRGGIQVVKMNFRYEHNADFVQVFNPLMSGYEKDSIERLEAKEKVLIEHEASQIVQLRLDQAAGKRAVFVSADRRLKRALLLSTALRDQASMVVPPQGFVGIVDVMVGLKTDKRSLARLIWAPPRRDSEQAIRDYLIRQALNAMDAALANAMTEVIDDVVAKGKLKAERSNLDLAHGNEVEDVARNAQFMDRLSEEFFETMRWWMQKRETEAEKDSPNSWKKKR